MSGTPVAPAAAEDGSDAGQQGAFLRRAEVRDVLAWVRLLLDPQDAVAVARALARPPIELSHVEMARVIQVARRRERDLLAGLAAAIESPLVPPEARERIERFLDIRRGAAGELDVLPPVAFLDSLIERLGGRGRPLLAPQDAMRHQQSLARLRTLAEEFLQLRPTAGARELARHLASSEPLAAGSRALPDADAVLGAGAAAGLPQAFHALREEVLASVARIGGRLGELRLDTELDIAHGVVRYLELLKLAALLQRPDGQALDDAIADVNGRLLAACSPLQREILQTSTLDTELLAHDPGRGGPSRAPGAREEHSLDPFLPRRGVGLALSASDIQTYRSCPLRYKYARVLRIPTEQTVHQRFGIVVHQVLERYHSERASGLPRMLELLEAGWRRSSLGERGEEGELLERARAALRSYHERLASQDSEPVWFERQFDFRIGPHHLRGRVDRVDRLRPAGGGGEGESEYELIDYKTSRPKTPEQLREDVQLSLYALAAREAWQLGSSRQAYYYVLDDLKVPVPRAEHDEQAVREIVLDVGRGILEQAFEPSPSLAACSICDYRIICPVAEA